MGHGLRRLPGHHTVPDTRRQDVTTEGVSVILRRGGMAAGNAAGGTVWWIRDGFLKKGFKYHKRV